MKEDTDVLPHSSWRHFSVAAKISSRFPSNGPMRTACHNLLQTPADVANVDQGRLACRLNKQEQADTALICPGHQNDLCFVTKKSDSRLCDLSQK